MTDQLNSSLSLYQLMHMVDDAVRTAMPSTYWVRAEVLNVHHRGYYRLELSSYEDNKPAKATAMIWQSQKHIVEKFEKVAGTRLATGLKILVRLEVGFDAQYGLRLVVVEFDPAFSLGDMEARLNAMRARLTDLGEIDLNRQLPEARDFTRVAVVAPESAAGLGDFRTQADMLEKYALCRFSYFSALFQSEKNVESFMSAFQRVIAAHEKSHFDAIVIIRGGGDKAGLYELNQPKIARAVCRLPIPVLVGVGHERDTTILDELANRSFPTPSLVVAHILNAVIDNARGANRDYLKMQKQASVLLETSRQNCVNSNERLLRFAFDKLNIARKQTQDAHFAIRTEPLEQLAAARQSVGQYHNSLQRNAEGAIHSLKASIVAQQIALLQNARLRTVSARENITRARTSLINLSREALLGERHRLQQLKQATSSSTRLALQSARHAIGEFQSVIKHLDPENVLARGFALVFADSGDKKSAMPAALVTSKKDAMTLSQLKIRFRDGQVAVSTSGGSALGGAALGDSSSDAGDDPKDGKPGNNK